MSFEKNQVILHCLQNVVIHQTVIDDTTNLPFIRTYKAFSAGKKYPAIVYGSGETRTIVTENDQRIEHIVKMNSDDDWWFKENFSFDI